MQSSPQLSRGVGMATVFLFSFAAGLSLLHALFDAPASGKAARRVIVPKQDLAPGVEFEGEQLFQLQWVELNRLPSLTPVDCWEEIKGPWESTIPLHAGEPLERKLLHFRITRPISLGAVGKPGRGSVPLQVDVPLAECGWIEAGDWVRIEGRQTLAYLSFTGVRVLDVEYHCGGWSAIDEPQLRLSLLIPERIENTILELQNHRRLRVWREPSEAQYARACHQEVVSFLQPLWLLGTPHRSQ